MGPAPPDALPPVTAEYKTIFQQTGSPVPPAQSASRFSRSADGKTCVDTGNMSVINNPAGAETIILDHAKKTATVQPPAPPVSPAAGMPQMPKFSPPGLPAPPQPPGTTVEDLGKSVMQGQEVEGKRFVTQPPAPPATPALQPPGAPKPPAFQAPGMPKPPALQVPGMPKPPALQVPGMPKAPALQVPGMPKLPGLQAPAAPKPPQMGAPPPPATPPPPTTTEVWNSTQLKVPMLTKMNGGFGQVTQVCQKVIPGEPHPSPFQIPKDYKVIGAAPKLPFKV